MNILKFKGSTCGIEDVVFYTFFDFYNDVINGIHIKIWVQKFHNKILQLLAVFRECVSPE